MIELCYLPVTFKISFSSALEHISPVHYAFVLRSVLGYNLRSMTCIAHGKECPSCAYNKICAYAYIFETIIPQNNSIHTGTDRATHPFSFCNCSESAFTINLYGKACDYLPYIYAAFYKAGQKGLFKERIPFAINDVKIGGHSIMIDEENLDTNNSPLDWKFDSEFNIQKKSSKEILVELKTPLRFKTKGKYSVDFTAHDFMQCLFRRAKTLCALYGSYENVPFYDNNNIELEIEERNIRWKDYEHYSARQKKAMQLGGVIGTFKLKGKFSNFDLALLDFARICNAGKNPNFGLGQIDFWER